ncbi:hypothetical protein [Halalkalibacterium ligniniphilum]|uniref:hypothetical protein n=1 Tax=Halalkalibacterium ligniniphilum TaxID=1134413 RepID=UPI00034A0A58|nr:hypothetical protein [Halalkalibacterium ligniniphilum]
MFRGNKIVLLLPGLLMIFIFLGGYLFMEQEEEMTNEELQEVIDINIDTKQENDSLFVRAAWDWTEMPVEGLYGEDYISVAIENEALLDKLSFDEGFLRLFYGHEVIYENKGRVVDNGVIFPFPNELREFESYGNRGEIEVLIEGEQVRAEDVSVYYLHTWTAHLGLVFDDARFESPQFENGPNVQHWVVKREAHIE